MVMLSYFKDNLGSLVLTLKGSSEHRAAAKAYFVERHLKFEVLGKIERTVD